VLVDELRRLRRRQETDLDEEAMALTSSLEPVCPHRRAPDSSCLATAIYARSPAHR
jgi:hypothetical protein